jgi:MATE family multidrug resistance protein
MARAGLAQSMAAAILIRSELKDTLKLAWPIVLAQVGHMSMGLVDTLVAGRIGTSTLAGLGLASNVFWTFTGVCMGCLLSLDTFFSQSVGANDEDRLAKYLEQSWWACLMVSIASAILIIAGTLIYTTNAALTPVTEAFSTYIWNIVWCLPTLFVFFVLQRYWQARHRVMPFMLIILGANVLNLLACFALGLGWWGFPNLGVRGIAWATNLSRYTMLLAGVIFTWMALKPESLKVPRPLWQVQKTIFGLGIPAAGHTALEVGAFTIVTFVAGALGAASLAAHHVCLMMAAFTFMFPLGFSAAAAVRVGVFIGAGEPARARLAGWLCIGVSVGVMSLFAIGYLTIPRGLLSIFTQDQQVVAYGVRILMLVAVFQIADGIQVCTTGALRGLGNTRTAMLANLFGHYPVGLLAGLILCFGLNLGVVGLWCGLASGLIVVAALLIASWRWHTRNLSLLRPVEDAATRP